MHLFWPITINDMFIYDVLKQQYDYYTLVYPKSCQILFQKYPGYLGKGRSIYLLIYPAAYLRVISLYPPKQHDPMPVRLCMSCMLKTYTTPMTEKRNIILTINFHSSGIYPQAAELPS